MGTLVHPFLYDMVSVHNKNTFPGDSPELMPLDCHLFSDIKEGVAQNVALSFSLKDDDPYKYSLGTPMDYSNKSNTSGTVSSTRYFKVTWVKP